MDFSKMTALVWDTGLGMEHASRLAEDFWKVVYYNPYQKAFCSSTDEFLGKGMVKKTRYFFEEVPKADLIVSTDIGQGDLFAQLRKEGKVVFGAGSGEKFENHRFAFRQLQKKIGLPTQETVECVGMSALEKYLEKNPKKWVKVDNNYRGDCESFFAQSLEAVRGRLNLLRVAFGPFDEKIPFTVEEEVEAVGQIGGDWFFNGEWVRPCLYGFERGRSYVGHFAETLPPFLEDFMERMKKPMQQRDYRGCFSSEHRIVSAKKAYMIDPTARPPYSLSVGYGKWIKNFSEVFWKVAKGEEVRIQPIAPYVAGTPIYTKNEDKWVRWEFPPEIRDHVRFRECAKEDGKFWAIKGCGSAAFVVGWGRSVEEAMDEVRKYVEKVHCDDEDKTRVRDLDDIVEEIKAVRKVGVEF